MSQYPKLVKLDQYLSTTKVPAQYQQNRERLVTLLNAVQQILGVPIQLTSGYRAPSTNTGAGGVSTSAHLTASAADFVVPGMTTPEIARKLLAAKQAGKMPGVGELIFYPFKPGQDCHISLPGAGGNEEWMFATHEGGYKFVSAADVAKWTGSAAGRATLGGLALVLLLIGALLYLAKGG